MKRLFALLCISITCLFAGCQTLASLPTSTLALQGHADAQAAAAYATANGYPARAAMWVAIDTQITACEAAIAAAAPKPPTTGTAPAGPHLALDFEVGAEAIGNFSGIPASVKVNCAPLPLIIFPVIPKL